MTPEEIEREIRTLVHNSPLKSVTVVSVRSTCHQRPSEVRGTDVRFAIDADVDNQLWIAPHDDVGSVGSALRWAFRLHAAANIQVSGKPSCLIASVEVAVEATYTLSPGFPMPHPDVLGTYANSSGLIHAWPFARELVADQFRRMGHESVMLPPLPMDSSTGAARL